MSRGRVMGSVAKARVKSLSCRSVVRQGMLYTRKTGNGLMGLCRMAGNLMN
jgi:hypothetical protein